MPASWYRADPYGFPIQTLRALTIITQNKALSLTPAGQKYLITCSTVILCSVDGLSRWEPHTCLAKEGYYHNCLSREWRSGRADRRDIFNPHASFSSWRTCKHTHTNPRHSRAFREGKGSRRESVCVFLPREEFNILWSFCTSSAFSNSTAQRLSYSIKFRYTWEISWKYH